MDILTKDERKFLAAKGYEDPVFFCQFFLPNLFPKPLTWFQRAIIAILLRRCEFLPRYGELDRIIENFVFERDGIIHHIFKLEDGKLTMNLSKYTLIEMPRGFSKTTLCGIAMPVFLTVYHCVDVFLYVSSTGAHSEMQLANVKNELSTNGKIIEIFGDLKPKRADDERWAASQFETTSGVTMISRGAGGQVRGLNHKSKRPKLVIGDDLEDKELVQSDTQRQKMRTWMYGDLMPVLPAMDDEASIIILGTMLHMDSLLVTLESDPQWTVVKMAVIGRDNKLLWPEHMDEKKLEVVKHSFTLAGELTTFYQEYYNKSIATEQQKFRKEFFYYTKPEKSLKTAIYCDPAIGQKKTADFTVIMVAGIETGGRIFVLDSFVKRGALPRETIDKYFELHIQWKCSKAGVESTAYQAALIHLMREEMFRKKHYFEITPVTHTKAKEARIEGILQPRFANGYIHFAKRCVSLETQLLDWPMAKHDDEADALAGVIALLDPYAAHASGDADMSKDIYEPLTKVLNGNQRRGVKPNVGSP